MTNFARQITAIKRPKLLLQAARYGAGLYKRDRDLRRILATNELKTSGDILPQLLAKEAEMDALRREETAFGGKYDVGRHIEILIAIISEPLGLLRADDMPEIGKIFDNNAPCTSNQPNIS